MKYLNLITLLFAAIPVIGCTASAQSSSAPTADATPMDTTEQNPRVEIVTTAGNVVIELYNDTPKHRDNFLRLAREGYYDGLLFHRVIKDFMVQTGDPESKDAPAGKMLGSGDPGYEIDAEILFPKYINRRGALAAARTGDAVNPERRSSGSQFYIVTGRKVQPGQLQQMEQQLKHNRGQEIFNRLAEQHRDSIMSMRRNRDQAGLQQLMEQLNTQTLAELRANPVGYTDEQKRIYAEEGGAPHLDGAYTVFGRVVQGMDVVERIEGVATDGNDRPLEDVKILSTKVLE